MGKTLLDLKMGRIARLHSRKGLFIGDIMENVIPTMQVADPTDTGGYFGVFDLETGLPLDLFPIGEFPSAEKAQRYLANCLEKADRLHRWVKCGHITSWESRDPDEMPAELRKRYGGAIIIDNLIYSFSGFSEHGDEWVCVIAAETNGGHLRLSRSRELITRLTGNPHLLT
jgi:hypothetical protein